MTIDDLVTAMGVARPTLSRGLTMRAQMGMPRARLLKDAEKAAELVLLPRAGN